MINDLVGRGSEKASQRGWLFVNSRGQSGRKHGLSTLGESSGKSRKRSCLGDHCYHLRGDGGRNQDVGDINEVEYILEWRIT